MHVLVTGAAGFVGSAMVRRLGAANVRVTATARSPGAVLPGDLSAITGDLADPSTPLPSDIDAIIHAAARSPGPTIGVDAFLKDNVIVTRRIADHALALGCPLVFLSSLSVYGRVETPVVDEATTIVDPEPYGLSKRLCEMLLEERSCRGLSALAVRLPGVLGACARTPWLVSVLHHLRAGELVPIYNPDAPFNNAVHVNDLTDFCLDWLRRPSAGFDIVTLGAGGTLSIREVVQLLAAAAGTPPARLVERDGPSSFVISSDKAIARHDYRPRPIDELLRRFATESQ